MDFFLILLNYFCQAKRKTKVMMSCENNRPKNFTIFIMLAEKSEQEQ